MIMSSLFTGNVWHLKEVLTQINLGMVMVWSALYCHKRTKLQELRHWYLKVSTDTGVQELNFISISIPCLVNELTGR